MSIASPPPVPKKTAGSGTGASSATRVASSQRRLVRLVAEDVVRGEGAELRGDRLGDLDAAVADVGKPETGRRVEVLLPRRVPDRASLAAREDELVPVDLAHRREGVPESRLRGHETEPIG